MPSKNRVAPQDDIAAAPAPMLLPRLECDESSPWLAANIQVIEDLFREALREAIKIEPSDLAAFLAQHFATVSQQRLSFEVSAAGWASGQSDVPKEMKLRVVEATLAQIAPLAVEKLKHEVREKELNDQLQQLRDAFEEGATGLSISQVTYTKSHLKHAKQRAEDAATKLDAAMALLDETTHTTSQAITGKLADDKQAYDDALRSLDAAENGQLVALTERVESLVNCSTLDEGEVVEAIAIEGDDKDRLIQHRVDRLIEGDTYEVSPWSFFIVQGCLYQEGFDLRPPARSHKVRMKRAKLYAKQKQRQQLSDHALDLAAQRQRGPTSSRSTEFLLLLYADAERTLPLLLDLCTGIRHRLVGEGAQVFVHKAPLKGLSRATLKTREKYDGDFAKLTDIARATFECSSLRDVRRVLDALVAEDGWTLLLIKNRLMPEFDASESGGYRDMLLNLRCVATKHIVEVQITLKPLLRIKQGGVGGGHANYALARLLKLNETATTSHQGSLSPRILKELKSGILTKLQCVGPCGLSTQFDALVDALTSPHCSLSTLVLGSCDWPAGKPIMALLEPISRLGAKLKHLSVCDMFAGGELPSSFFERCTELQNIDFGQMNLSGPIPASIGKLSKLTWLLLSRNKLQGCIPDELGNCTRLSLLSCHTNNLTGVPSAALTRCPNLHFVNLHTNELSGELPKEYAEMPELKFLKLADNSPGVRVSEELRGRLEAKPTLREGSAKNWQYKKE